MNQTTKPIPQEVLRLLRKEWAYEAGVSIWEFVWNRVGRRSDPSGYFIRQDSKDINPVTFSEIKALMKAGVLDGLAKEEAEGDIWLNEHAAHALQDFIGETHTAYQKMLGRLKMVRVAQKD